MRAQEVGIHKAIGSYAWPVDKTVPVRVLHDRITRILHSISDPSAIARMD